MGGVGGGIVSRGSVLWRVVRHRRHLTQHLGLVRLEGSAERWPSLKEAAIGIWQKPPVAAVPVALIEHGGPSTANPFCRKHARPRSLCSRGPASRSKRPTQETRTEGLEHRVVREARVHELRVELGVVVDAHQALLRRSALRSRDLSTGAPTDMSLALQAIRLAQVVHKPHAASFTHLWQARSESRPHEATACAWQLSSSRHLMKRAARCKPSTTVHRAHFMFAQ